jgi:hypothetical protein
VQVLDYTAGTIYPEIQAAWIEMITVRPGFAIFNGGGNALPENVVDF